MKGILIAGMMSVALFGATTASADCPQLYAECVVMANGICNAQGSTYVDSCWSWPALECEPCANADNQCNAAFSTCNGNCTALSTDQSGAECNADAVRDSNVIRAFKAKKGNYIRLRADEILMRKIHQQQLGEKLDPAARKYLVERQASDVRIIRKMQSDALNSKH